MGERENERMNSSPRDSSAHLCTSRRVNVDEVVGNLHVRAINRNILIARRIYVSASLHLRRKI